MRSSYSEVLRLPGAWRFSLAGALLRLPMSMVGISTILLIKSVYGNYTAAGVISAVGVISYAIGAPILARLVDKYGQRRVMVPSLIISLVMLIAVITAGSAAAPLPLVAVCSSVSGATSGSGGALVRARWAHVITTPRQLSQAYAFEAAVDEIVYIVGPVLATVLGTAVHPASGLVISGIAILLGAIGFLSQRSTEPPVSQREDNEKNLPSVLRNPVIVILFLTFIAMGAMFGGIDVSVVAFTEARGVSALAGPLLALNAFGSFLAALIYGSGTWRRPQWQLFASGVVLLAIGASTLLTAKTLLILGVVLLITGITIAPTMTNANTIVAKVSPPRQLTEGLTWMSTGLSLGVSLGSAMGGRIIDANGAGGGFATVAAAAWLMAVVMVIGLPRLRRDTLAKERESHLPPELFDKDGSADSSSTDV